MAQSSTDVVETRASLREEMAGGDLGDDRLNARRDRLIDVLEQSPDTGFPAACASDGDVEALYRFLRNPRVSLRAVLEPHLAATQARCRALDEVLVIHDTTECSFAGAQVRAGLTPPGSAATGLLGSMRPWPCRPRACEPPWAWCPCCRLSGRPPPAVAPSPTGASAFGIRTSLAGAGRRV